MISYCMALTLAKRNIPCIVYEKSSSVKYVPSESYPIGVNQRGMVALRNAGGSALEKAIANDGFVEAWKIYVGNYNVATQGSGVVVGTTRGKVNELLATGISYSTLFYSTSPHFTLFHLISFHLSSQCP